jgi:hypothetical protein
VSMSLLRLILGRDNPPVPYPYGAYLRGFVVTYNTDDFGQRITDQTRARRRIRYAVSKERIPVFESLFMGGVQTVTLDYPDRSMILYPPIKPFLPEHFLDSTPDLTNDSK